MSITGISISECAKQLLELWRCSLMQLDHSLLNQPALFEDEVGAASQTHETFQNRGCLNRIFDRTGLHLTGNILQRLSIGTTGSSSHITTMLAFVQTVCTQQASKFLGHQKSMFMDDHCFLQSFKSARLGANERAHAFWNVRLKRAALCAWLNALVRRPVWNNLPS